MSWQKDLEDRVISEDQLKSSDMNFQKRGKTYFAVMHEYEYIFVELTKGMYVYEGKFPVKKTQVEMGDDWISPLPESYGAEDGV